MTTTTKTEMTLARAMEVLTKERDRKLQNIARRLGHLEGLKETGNTMVDTKQVHVRVLANMLLAAYNTGAADQDKRRFPRRANLANVKGGK